MHDSGCVSPGEPVGNLNGVLQSVLQGQAIFSDQLIEGLAGDELHGNEIRAVRRADVVNVDDVGVIQGRRGLGFLHEAALAFGAGGSVGAQDFDGDGTVEMSVEGAIHHSHAAFTELCFNPVVAQKLADHWVHVRASLLSESNARGRDRRVRSSRETIFPPRIRPSSAMMYTMTRRLSHLLVLLWTAPWARAQTLDPAVRELIERMQTRIDSLEKRVAELEHEKGTPAQTVAPRPSPEAVHMSHDQAPPPVTAMGEAVQPGYPSLKINGFGDINFAASDLHAPA